jgi:sulfonate transport system substrate-binding protein
LRGKRLGIPKGNRSHLVFHRIIAKHGFREADFDIVNLRGHAAIETAFAAGEVDARMIEIGELADPDQLRSKRIISDFGNDPIMGSVGKLAVSAEFERQYPTVVQRVVTTLVKSAAWICDERNRTAVLELWASSPERLAALRSASSGPLLKQRMSPLMDEYFMAEIRRDSDDAKRFGMIPADADMSFEGWVEPKYLKQALKDLHLESYWPEYDAEGKPKPDNVVAR